MRMLRARNLAAFVLPVQAALALAGCQHVGPSARTGRTERVAEGGLTGRWLTPDVAAPGSPALLIVGTNGGSGLPPGFSTRLATAAMEAGVASLELPGGDPGQALLWLGPRARRLFVAAAGDNVVNVAPLGTSGHVAGFVLFSPPAPPAPGSEASLVIRGGDPSSKQTGRQWEVAFPDLQTGHTLTADDEPSILELVVLWLRNRAAESVEWQDTEVPRRE
jgi:hypothetical protein